VAIVLEVAGRDPRIRREFGLDTVGSCRGFRNRLGFAENLAGQRLVLLETWHLGVRRTVGSRSRLGWQADRQS